MFAISLESGVGNMSESCSVAPVSYIKLVFVLTTALTLRYSICPPPPPV